MLSTRQNDWGKQFFDYLLKKIVGDFVLWCAALDLNQECHRPRFYRPLRYQFRSPTHIQAAILGWIRTNYLFVYTETLYHMSYSP